MYLKFKNRIPEKAFALAERVGFEPTGLFIADTTDFKSVPL